MTAYTMESNVIRADGEYVCELIASDAHQLAAMMASLAEVERLRAYHTVLAAAPAAPVAQEPSTFWVLFDATADKKYIKKMIPDGTLAFFDCESDALRAKARNPGTDYKRVDYYTAPPSAEQPECVTCSGHGLVGNRLDDGEECPECHGAGIIWGTECGACAEQPDTVAVPDFAALVDKWRTHAKMLRKDKQPNVADMADDCADDLRALLYGGEK